MRTYINSKSPSPAGCLHDGKPVSLIVQANPIDEISEAWKENCAFFATLAIMAVSTFTTVNLLFNKILMLV